MSSDGACHGAEFAYMPILLHTLDEQAKRQRRDVLGISFLPVAGRPFLSVQQMPISRANALNWFEKQQVTVTPVHIALSPGTIECPYFGDLLIDVPVDNADPLYRLVLAEFEENAPLDTDTKLWIAKYHASTSEPNEFIQPNS